MEKHSAQLKAVVNDKGGVIRTCLLYTSDAADDLLCVALGGRRLIKNKKKKNTINIKR